MFSAAQDVQEYILDALGTYASLQKFAPAPSVGAKPLTAKRLLQHFLFDEDREAVLKTHPWLRCALDRGV